VGNPGEEIVGGSNIAARSEQPYELIAEEGYGKESSALGEGAKALDRKGVLLFQANPDEEGDDMRREWMLTSMLAKESERRMNALLFTYLLDRGIHSSLVAAESNIRAQVWRSCRLCRKDQGSKA
jgi:hypothetical protein